MTQEQIIQMIEETKSFMEIVSRGSSQPEYYKGVVEGMELILNKLNK
jgi:hypothetical protein